MLKATEYSRSKTYLVGLLCAELDVGGVNIAITRHRQPLGIPDGLLAHGITESPHLKAPFGIETVVFVVDVKVCPDYVRTEVETACSVRT